MPSAVTALTALAAAAIIAIAAMLYTGSGEGVSDAGPARSLQAQLDTTMPTCGGAQQRRPRTIDLACADSGQRLTGLRWRAWGEPVAHASGTLELNACEPDCSRGQTRRIPRARARLSTFVLGSGANGSYSRLTVTYRTGRYTTTEQYLLLGDFGPVPHAAPIRRRTR